MKGSDVWGVAIRYKVCVMSNLLPVIIKYSSMGYSLYFINQSRIQSVLIITSLWIVSFPIWFLKKRRRGGVTTDINGLLGTYLVPGPGLSADCQMVNSPNSVPALMKFIFVRRDQTTQSLACPRLLTVSNRYTYQLKDYKLMHWFVPIASPPAPLFLFHQFMGGRHEREHLL